MFLFAKKRIIKFWLIKWKNDEKTTLQKLKSFFADVNLWEN